MPDTPSCPIQGCTSDKPLLYKNPEDPEQRICQACYRRLKRHERGLKKPGAKRTVIAPVVQYRLTNAERTCVVRNCEAPVQAVSLCSKHYQLRMRSVEPYFAVVPVVHRAPLAGECSILGCGRPKYRGGYCQRCFARWVRHGDPTTLLKMPDNIEWDLKTFFSYTERQESGCIFWVASYYKGSNYGYLYDQGVAWLVHRWLFTQFVGAPKEGLVVDHMCHNGTGCKDSFWCPHRRCVNPQHLEPVSNQENILRGYSPPAAHALATKCPQGHIYNEENTKWKKRSNGEWVRECYICHSEREKQRYWNGEREKRMDKRRSK